VIRRFWPSSSLSSSQPQPPTEMPAKEKLFFNQFLGPKSVCSQLVNELDITKNNEKVYSMNFSIISKD
jgi:hypothetical protein